MGEPAAADHLDFPKHTIVPLGKSVGEVLGGSFKKGPLEVTSAIPPAPRQAVFSLSSKLTG